jgi:hypothetical protein
MGVQAGDLLRARGKLLIDPDVSQLHAREWFGFVTILFRLPGPDAPCPLFSIDHRAKTPLCAQPQFRRVGLELRIVIG